MQQTDTFTPLEEKAEEDLQNQKNTSGRKNKKEDSQAVARETQNVADAVRIEEQKEHPVYHTPPISLLKKGRKAGGDSDAHLRATALKLEQTLRNFRSWRTCDEMQVVDRPLQDMNCSRSKG